MIGLQWSEGGSSWSVDERGMVDVSDMALIAVQFEEMLNALPATAETDNALCWIITGSLQGRCKRSNRFGNFWAAILEMVRERREQNRAVWA